MARKATKKSSESAPGKETPPAVSPFAETVPSTEASSTEPPRPARVFKVGKPVPSISASVEPTPAKRPRKTKTVAASDPFAQIAGTSPVKKARKTKPAAAESKAERPVAAAAPNEPAKPKKRTAAKKIVSAEVAPEIVPAVGVELPKDIAVDVTPAIASAPPAVEVSPVFKALADVTLPPLRKENRARLLLQSPTRAYFYWSVRRDPWQQLRAVFGEASNSYSLVVKLTNLTSGSEDFYPAEPKGERWFDVHPDKKYEAEVGFYAPNRPYFRIVYSNTIETPRRSPSPHPATDARWTLSANKFAEVLDASGFTRDAVDVAITGDDARGAADMTQTAFSKFVGGGDFTAYSAEDLRYAMLSVAAGISVDDLRFRVDEPIYAALKESPSGISAERSRAVLKEHFNIDDTEWTEEEFGPAVHGASLIHFPRSLKPRKISSTFAPRYNPVSSHSLG